MKNSTLSAVTALVKKCKVAFLVFGFIIIGSQVLYGQTITPNAGGMVAVTTTYGTASATPATFTVAGTSLAAGITVTPPAGFQVSQTDATSGYAAAGVAIVVPDVAGTVNTTTIYVRLASTTAVGTYSGNIVLTSTSATENVATVSSDVTAKALTITGITISNKVYNATTAATIAGTAALVGVVNSDDVTLGGTPVAVFTTAIVGDNKATNVSGYTLGGAGAGNYSLTQPSGLTANITAKALTITGITISNKVYDATTSASIAGTAALSGVETGDVANVTLGGTPVAVFTTAVVGTGKATTVSGYSISGSASGNYSLTQPSGLTADVTAKPITITGITISNKVYDATTSASIAGTAALSGVETGDVANVTLGGSPVAVFTTAVVGTGKATTVSGYSISGSASGNYSLTQPSGLTANITAKPITITGITISNKVYDATTSASIAGTAALNGVETGDVANVTLGGSPVAVFTTAVVGTGKATTVSGYSLSGSASGNYSVTQPSGLTADVTAKPITITGITISNKVYDATTSASIAGTAALSGVETGDVANVTLGGSPVAVFTTAVVGTGKATTVSGYSISGSASGNYSLTQPSGLTANITAKPITITGITISNKVYDATTSASIAGTAALNGVETGDVANVTLGGSPVAVFTTAVVGTGKATTVSGYSLSGSASGNYSVTQPSGLTADVTAKPITITGITISNKVYDATTSASIAGTAALSGVETGDVANVTLGGSPVAVFTTAVVGTGKATTVSGYSISGSASGNYSLTQPSGLTADVTAKPITITGITISNKVYDGTTSASIAGTAALSGVETGDVANVTLGGTPVAVFTTAVVGTGKATTVSGYSISGSASGNYSLTQPSGLTANITAKPITITGITISNKVYDGTTSASIAGTAALNGVETGDVANVTLGGTPVAVFTTAVVGTGKATTVSGYSLSGSASGNYSVTQPSGLTADVTAKPITITGITISNKVYDGTTSASIAGTAALSGVETGDVANVTLGGTPVAVFTTAVVGTGKATTVSGYSISGSASGNYSLTQPSGLTANITAKPITITGITISNKVYDATTSASIAGTAALNGVETGDVANVTLGGTPVAVFTTAAAGTAKATTVSGYSISGSASGNYSLTQPSGLTANITAKPITITGITISNKVYDATTSASIAGTAALNGVETGDVANVTLGGTPVAVFTTAVVGTGKATTVSGYSLSGSASGNYSVTQPSGLTADVTAKPITITGITISNKVYDGTTSASIAGTAALSGVETGDVANVTLGGTPVAVFTTAVVGTGKATTVSGYSISGSASGNYSLTQPSGLTANITAKPITITGITISNKVYDGTTSASIAGTAALNGVETGDVANVTLGGTPVAVFTTAVVGTGKATTVSGYSISGSASGNYSLTQPSGLTANITAKPITITGITISNKVYDATTSASIAGTAALNGVETGDVANVTLGGTPVAVFTTAVVGTGKATTVSGYSLSGSASGNYSVTQPSGLTANVTAKAITITGITISNKVYDATTSASIAGTAALSGVETGDVANVTLGGTPLAVFADALVGTGKATTVSGYSISGSASGNYSLTQPSGLTANITAKAVTITGITISNKVYNATTSASIAGTAALSGVETGDVANVTLGGTPLAVFADAAVGTGKATTVSGYSISGSASGNYSLTQPSGLTADITGVAITITASGPSKVYGTTLSAGTSAINFSVTSGTMVGTQAVTGITLTPDAAGISATTAGGAGYVVTPSLATGSNGFLASNYIITYAPFNGTVSLRPITITASGPSKVYGTALSTGTSASNFSVTSGTMVGTESVTGVTLTPNAAGLSATTAYNAAYTVTPSLATGINGFSAGNYDITYVAFNGTVTRTALTVTATGPSKAFGVALTAGTSTTNFSVTGTLVSGEALTSVTLTPDAAGLSAATAAAQPYVVTPSAATGTGGFLASNYDITYTAFNGTVGQLAITITATGPTVKAYGTALSAGTSATNFSVTGTLNTGEAVTGVTLTPNAAGLSATTAAGAAYVITPSLATGSGGFLAANYTITYIAYNGTVATAPLTITATGPSKTYGTALSAGTSATNFTAGTTQNSETVTGVTLTPNAAGLSATTAAGAGYIVTPSLATGGGGFLASNYNITYTPFNGTVATAPLTITATGPAKTYGAVLSAEASTTNFTAGTTQNSEVVTGVTLTPNAAGLSGTTAALAGYVVTPSAATGSGGFLASNYNITYTPFNGNVTTRTLSIKADDRTKFVGTTLGMGTTAFTPTGLQNSETIGGVTLTSSGSASGAAINTYPIVASAATGGTFNASNYAISYVDGTLSVTNSTNANLSALAISGATLSPVFSSGTTAYTATVPNLTTSVTATGTLDDATATMKVNTVTTASGVASAALPLTVGTNVISVAVTAQDGTTIKTYQVTVTRQASAIADLSAYVISSGTLSPAFNTSTTAYTDTVANAVSSVTITPTVTQANATITVGGTTVASGAASAAIPLAVGETIIATVVTAQDGTTTKTYTTRVHRKGVPTLTVDPATLTLSSTVNVASNGSAFVTVTGSDIIGNTAATVAAPYEVSKDGSTGWATSVSFTAANFPTNTSTQKVYVRITPTTAGAVPASNLSLSTLDGVTKTVALNGTGVAAASNNADLASLTSSNYTLSPVFAAATTSYTASVANTVTSVSMVPTVAQANATIKINNVDVTSGSSGTVQLVVGANNISVVVRAQDQTTTKTYTVVITRSAQTLAVNEVAPDANGNVTVTTVKPEVKVVSPTQPVTVTVPAGTTNTTVDYSTLVNAPGKATVPQTTINSDVSKVEIPASTVFTASNPAWDGVITAPKVDIWTPPASDDETITTPGLVIQMGHPTIAFSLSRAIRLVLPAQAGMRAAYIHQGIYKEITTVGPSDSQAAGDALPTDGIFKIDVGADLVIWTKVLSQFLTFTQATDLNVAVVGADAAAISANDIKGANSDLNNITTTLTNPLPSLGAGGSAITWTSSNPAVVSNNGQTITRPVQGSPFPAVTMTATVKKGLITRTQSFALTVIPLPNQAPTFATIANQVLCFTTAPQSLTVTGITPGPESGQTTTLSVSSSNPGLLTGLAVNSATGVISYTPLNTAGGTATITVTATDNGGTVGGGVNTFSRTFTVTVNALPTVQIFNSIGTNDVSKGLTLTITAAGGSFYSWANASGIISGQNTAALTIRPTVTTTYTVTVTNATGCVNTQSITINVLEDYKALDINNLVSPNGDGVNDALVIKNLDMYPNNTVKVFDAAGRMLYSKQNYTNDWNGNFQGSPLTEGTYYYIVDFGNGKKILRGFVSIVNQQ